jgi:hypothetical protein
MEERAVELSSDTPTDGWLIMGEEHGVLDREDNTRDWLTRL